MKGRDAAIDLLVLPLLVVIHCAIVFVLVCLYIYGWDYLTYAPTIAAEVKFPRIVALFLAFGVPFGLATGVAWLNLRFILGKIVRTDAGRTVSAAVIFLYAFALPVFMIPIDLVIGCVVTSEKVGKSICL